MINQRDEIAGCDPQGTVCVAGNAEICLNSLDANTRIGFHPARQRSDRVAVLGCAVDHACLPVVVSLRDDRSEEFVKKLRRCVEQRNQQRNLRTSIPCARLGPLFLQIAGGRFMFRHPLCVIFFSRAPRNFLFWWDGLRQKYSPQLARNSREFARDAFCDRPARFRSVWDHKASTFIAASRLRDGERLLLLRQFGMHLLYLRELIVYDQLRIGAIAAHNGKTLGEFSDRSHRFSKQLLCFGAVSINFLEPTVEVSNPALLVLDHGLRFGPILDNRVEQSLARFEEAGATFDLSCLRSRPYCLGNESISLSQCCCLIEKCRAKWRCFRRDAFRRNAKADSFTEIRCGLFYNEIEPCSSGAILSLEAGPVHQDQRLGRQFGSPNLQFLPHRFAGIHVINQQNLYRTICEIGC